MTAPHDHTPPVPPNRREASPSYINRLISASLGQRFLVTLLGLMLVGAGIRSFRRLPVDAYPDLSPTMVEIVTQWPGHASEEVERLITVPVEIEMNGLPKLKVVRSISLYGLSDVTLTFEDGTDNYFARQEAFNR
ncbi:MAG: efflux RND transporter permease subunit, partial [Gemmatimonadaceae bacterium]